MKKTYTKPVAEAIALNAEGMIAASNYHNYRGNDKWHAPKRDGWDSDNWSQPADADDTEE